MMQRRLLVIYAQPKLNIGKRAFSVAALTIWNQLPVSLYYGLKRTVDTFHKKTVQKHISFHHKLLVVPCATDNFCLSLCVISQVIIFVVPLSLNF